jgi:hypothetical protein
MTPVRCPDIVRVKPKICRVVCFSRAFADFPSRLASTDASSYFWIMCFHLAEFSSNLGDFKIELARYLREHVLS